MDWPKYERKKKKIERKSLLTLWILSHMVFSWLFLLSSAGPDQGNLFTNMTFRQFHLISETFAQQNQPVYIQPDEANFARSINHKKSVSENGIIHINEWSLWPDIDLVKSAEYSNYCAHSRVAKVKNGRNLGDE